MSKFDNCTSAADEEMIDALLANPIIPVPADEDSLLVEKAWHEVLRLRESYGGWVAYGLQMPLSAYVRSQLLFVSSVFGGQGPALSMEKVQRVEAFLMEFKPKFVRARAEARARICARRGLVKTTPPHHQARH